MSKAHTSHFMSGGRYPVLRALGIIYLIGAGVVALAGIAGAIWALAAAPASWGDRINVALGILAATFFAVITMLVIAEVIKLAIDVEHNSRLCAMALAVRAEQTLAAPTPAGTVVAPTMADGTPVVATTDGVVKSRLPLHTPDEETAEAALIRGH